MKTFLTKDLNDNQARKLMSGSIAPRPIALISTLQENDKVNVAPFSWFNMVSGTPPILSVSVRYDSEIQKDTSLNILRNKEFVVHIISEDYLEKANKTAVSLSRTESELEFADLTQVKSTMIKTPGIKEAKVRMECKLVKHVELESTDLIIGEVVTFHIDENVYDNGKIDFVALNPVLRLPGQRYSLIGKIIEVNDKK